MSKGHLAQTDSKLSAGVLIHWWIDWQKPQNSLHFLCVSDREYAFPTVSSAFSFSAFPFHCCFSWLASSLIAFIVEIIRPPFVLDSVQSLSLSLALLYITGKFPPLNQSVSDFLCKGFSEDNGFSLDLQTSLATKPDILTRLFCLSAIRVLLLLLLNISGIFKK